MAVNRVNPFQEQYVDSFQGKNIDGDELQSLDTNSYLNIVSQYNIDDSGNLAGKVGSGVYVPNNPVPEDRSLQDPPPVDIIRVSNPVVLDVPAVGVDPRDVDVEVSPTGKLQRITVAPGRSDEIERRFSDRTRFSTAAPEDVIDPADRDDSTVDLSGFASRSDDGEMGPPIGLNRSARTVTKISNSKTASAINNGPFMEDLTKIEINTRPNELNKFSSYAYNIALYMINSRSYVDITKQPRAPQDVLDPTTGVSKLLMRSGGTGLDNFNTEFNNDFFIDDLEISSIAVGPSKFKHNTNATDIRFTITEPRGVTLLERLQDAAASVLVSTKERYIHAPYLLEISFKGYDEKGNSMPSDSTAKYIPIRITDMQFEVTASGTQYKVEAIPYANYAMGSIVSTIPFNIELSATTVGDIFSAGVLYETIEQRPVESRVQPFDQRAGTKTEIKKVKNKDNKAKNLGEVLTDYQKKRTKKTKVLSEKYNEDTKQGEIAENLIDAAATGYDTYKFLLAGEIANAKLNKQQLYDALNTPAPTEQKDKDSKDKSDRRQFDAFVQGAGQGVTLSKDLSTFKINAGTDISKLLNLVILHSDYMDQNIVDNPVETTSDGNGINWFKIRPIIESADGDGKGFDEKDGRYKYNITFAVEKNIIHYSDFPWARKSKPKGNGVHKKYDYLFSGSNTEVLNFDLKFRTAFMQVMSAGTGSPFANKRSNSTFAPLTKEVTQSIEGNTINGQDDIRGARAKDLFSSVMSDGVDMVELDLQIIGDPAYIPTSDAYWQDKVRNGETYVSAFMPDGTINYNVSAPYIQVNLKTPVDYNETTGLSNPNSYGNSSFSGVYRVTSVDSTFSGGQFQQRVNGIRTPLQPKEVGVIRDNQSAPNTERNVLALENASSGQQGKIQDTSTKGITNNIAKVVNVAASKDAYIDTLQDTPYTSPQVNNERTAQIAQQTDQSILTIDDPDNVSATQAWLSRWPTN